MIDIDLELDAYREKLESLNTLIEVVDELPDEPGLYGRGSKRDFANSLIEQFLRDHSLSPRQWPHVDRLVNMVKGAEPLYGNFAPILVMFRLTESARNGAGLKKPKIRLLSDAGTFVQLNFRPGERNERCLKVFTGGWSGHGRRRFAGWIADDRIIPYAPDRMPEDVRNVIQDLALDPAQTMKAMAARLGCCGFCAQALSDDRSKAVGYGEQCAINYGLPWGGHSNEPIDLQALFT